MFEGVSALRKRVFYGWWIVGAGSLSMFVGGLHNQGFSVFFIPISESLHLSRTATSFIFAAARLEGGLEAPIAGKLIDRFGARAMLMLGATVAGLGYILLGLFARDFWSFFLIYTLVLSTGFSAGFFSAIMAAYNTWFRRYRGRVFGTLHASIRGGAFILVPIVSFLVLNLGWQTAAVVAGILILAVVIPASLVFRESPESMGLQPDGDSPDAARRRQARGARQASSEAPAHEFTLSEATRTPSFWILALAQGVRQAAVGAIAVHAIPMFVWQDAGQQEAAFLVGAMSFLSIPSALFLGWLADRMRKGLVVALGTSVGVAALMLLAVADGKWMVYLFILLFAFAESTGPIPIALTGEYFGRRNFATIRGLMQF
ncbi:MAG: MFS transporter, partial [SAR202 cluster bacterium]|nr:MFS transporter [SAR202 cluster bacterium]